VVYRAEDNPVHRLTVWRGKALGPFGRRSNARGRGAAFC
jgi:hypothetical protein